MHPQIETYIYTPMKSRHLFTVKAIVAPIAGVAFFIWCIVRAHGVGPILSQPAQIHGSTLGWAMVSSIMSCISNMATLVTYVKLFRLFHYDGAYSSWSNAPDFASRSKRPSDAVLPQLISVPLSFSIVSFFGIVVSSSSQAIYGEAIWSPVDLLGMFLDDNPSSATRFGVSDLKSYRIILTLMLIHRSGSSLRHSLSHR